MGGDTVATLTPIESPVNPPVFSSTEFRAIEAYERGEDDFTAEVERAYLKLNAALQLGQGPPEGVTWEWWLEQAKQWGRYEAYWSRGKV
jgi:hypothetical protein